MTTGAKPSSKVAVIAWIVIAWMAATWIGHVSRPLLSEPLRHEVGIAVHVSELVLTVLFLGGLIGFKFRVKPWLPQEVQQRAREAVERERNRSVTPMLLVNAILLAIAVTLGVLLKFSGLVTDKRTLYACLMIIPPLVFAGYVGWRYRSRG